MLISNPVDPAGLPPQAVLQWLIIGDWISQAVQCAAKLGLADELNSGPRTVEDLAQAVDAHAPSLYRLLRALASVGVVTEVGPRRFALTPVGQYLRSGVPGSLRALARIHTEIDWAAWGDIFHSVRTGETAFQHVHGVPYFDHLRRHPELGKLFDEGMTEYVSMHGIAAAEAYDFSTAAKIVDVGGGHGALLRRILRQYPSATGIVFDSSEVIARADSSEDETAARLQFQGGDFFAEVPGGGDVYLMASILHDWDDTRARQILEACGRAMPDRATLLLVEMVVPPGDAPSFTKFLDLAMLVCFGGRERTEAEYQALLADAGFEVARLIPTASAAHIIEARKKVDFDRA